jgi:hypothetical protein
MLANICVTVKRTATPQGLGYQKTRGDILYIYQINRIKPREKIFLTKEMQQIAEALSNFQSLLNNASARLSHRKIHALNPKKILIDTGK